MLEARKSEIAELKMKIRILWFKKEKISAGEVRMNFGQQSSISSDQKETRVKNFLKSFPKPSLISTLKELTFAKNYH